MNRLVWIREHRLAFFATTAFGACIGVILGLRRIDPAVNQNLYWLWLGIWVVSGALFAGIGAYIRQMLRRSSNSGVEKEQCSAEEKQKN